MNILNVVHGGDSSIGISLLAVADETESTAAATVAVLDDDLSDIGVISWSSDMGVGSGLTYSLLNGTELLELLTERSLVCVPCEATEGSRLANCFSEHRDPGRELTQ